MYLHIYIYIFVRYTDKTYIYIHIYDILYKSVYEMFHDVVFVMSSLSFKRTCKLLAKHTLESIGLVVCCVPTPHYLKRTSSCIQRIKKKYAGGLSWGAHPALPGDRGFLLSSTGVGGGGGGGSP